MTRVFLSHSSQDKPLVNLVAGDIRACGVDVWIDEAELRIGDSCMARLDGAIKDSRFVLVFASSASVRSQWVTEEIAIAERLEALREDVVLLPILLPGLPDAELPQLLAKRVFADFRRPAH